MRKLLPVFYVVMVLLFCYQAFDQFSAPDRATYHMIAGVLAIMSSAYCATLARGAFQSNRRDRSSKN